MHRTNDRKPPGSFPPSTALVPARTRELVRQPDEGPPAMTMRVYRVAADGTRGPVEREVSVQATEDTVPEPMAYPPCTCPRCARGVR